MPFVETRSQSIQVALRALAPLSLMALIFVLSAQPDLDSGLIESREQALAEHGAPAHRAERVGAARLADIA